MEDNDTTKNALDAVRSTEVPALKTICSTLKTACNDLSDFFERCKNNYNVVTCKWENQNDDQRKHDNDSDLAFPFDGASDAKVPYVDDMTRMLKKTFSTSLRRMRVQAVPINANQADIRNSQCASYLLKYLKQTIPGFDGFADYSASQMLEVSGLAAAKVEYAKERRLVRQRFSIDQISPELGAVLIDDNHREESINALSELFPKSSKKIIGEALDDLKEKGYGYLTKETNVREGVRVYPMSLCENLIIPASTVDVQDAPFVFEIIESSPELFLQTAKDMGWDEEWAEEVVKKQTGVDWVQNYISGLNERNDHNTMSAEGRTRGMVQYARAWEKRIDEDGAIGVYYTVFHPEYITGEDGEDTYGIFELSDCVDGQYPFVIRKRENLSRRLIDTRALTEVLEGYQFIYKEFIDNAVNRESISTYPPYEVNSIGGLNATNTQDIGPGTRIQSTVGNSFNWRNPIQGGENWNVEMRKEVARLGDMYIGRASEEVPQIESQAKIQGEIDTLGSFVSDVLKMDVAKFKQYAPAEMSLKIIGAAASFIWKNDTDTDYDYIVTLDASSIDDTIAKLEAFSKLAAQDRTGKIDSSKLIEIGAQLIDLVIADQVITGDETAYNKSIEEERGAINTITSGQDIDISPDEPYNQVKAQYFMQYLQTPAGQAGLQNQIIAPLLEKRAKQWQFKADQQQNAQIGLIGTKPGTAGTQ